MAGYIVQVRTWQESQRNQAVEGGFVRSMLGRQRMLPGAQNFHHKKRVTQALRAATTVQVLPPCMSYLHASSWPIQMQIPPSHEALLSIEGSKTFDVSDPGQRSHGMAGLRDACAVPFCLLCLPCPTDRCLMTSHPGSWQL